MSTAVNFSIYRDFRVDDLLVQDFIVRTNAIQPFSPGGLLRIGGGTPIKTKTVTIVPGNSNQILTITQLLNDILLRSPPPGGVVTWTTPTAALVVSGITSAQVNDSIDFSIVNPSIVSGQNITLVAGSGSTIVGQAVIQDSNTSNKRSSGKFRLVLNNITTGTEAYTIYRLS